MEHLSAAYKRRGRSLVVLAMALVYSLALCWLSLARHEAHLSNALDLGYYSDTLWNTAHGDFFHFSTFHAAQFALPEFDPNRVRQQDNLLAYHVEPVLLPLSLLYLVWPDARALLILQTLVLASGAIPAYWIAHRHLSAGESTAGPLSALAFPLIYLLSPSLVGANLADFHPVTLSAALVLWAFELRERHAYRAYFICVALLLALKEEMGLLVAMLGLFQVYRSLIRLALPLNRRALHMALRNERVRIGLATILLAAAWTTCVIFIQREAAGQAISLFASRYSWLGHSMPDVLRNVFTTNSVPQWLLRPDVSGYLGFLLAQVGFVALLAPDVLLIAAPEIAINTFSRFDWMRSGVAHYSAAIVPVLVIASIFGVKRAADAPFWMGVRTRSRGEPGRNPPEAARRPKVSTRAVASALSLMALAAAAYQAYLSGQLPLTLDFKPFSATAHDERLSAVASLIPAGASAAAQSDLYPHVAGRANLYLFPTIADAEYILLDVSGQSYPLSAGDYAAAVQQLVYETPLGIIYADDGYLLLGRDAGTHTDLPDSFFSFLRADAGTVSHPLHVRFGNDVELLGYDFEILPPRQLSMPSATIRTYWRALQPLNDNLRFTFCFYAPQGYLGFTRSGSPAEWWYPTSKWRAGEVVVVEQRAVQVARGGRVGVRVETGGDAAPTVLEPQASGELLEAGVVKLVEVQ